MRYLRTTASMVVVLIMTISLARPAAAQDALDKMEVVFEGYHTRAEIKRHMDRALRLYDLPVNEEYYNKAGSVLVSLVNSEDVHATEMEILKCTIRAHTPNIDLEYHQMAALCATQLSN